MGCTNSKVDDLPAVSLCRDRCSFLSEAIKHRYALAAAHTAYLHSLSSVGSSLHLFFLSSASHPPSSSPPLKTNTASRSVPPPSSSSAPVRHNHSHSHSGSHLHFHDSDDDDDDVSPSDSPLHLHHHHDESGNSSPVHTYGHDIGYNGPGISYNGHDNDYNGRDIGRDIGYYGGGNDNGIGGFMNMNNNMHMTGNFNNNMYMSSDNTRNDNMYVNYMKKEATKSVSVVLQEERPNETVTMNYMRNEVTPSVSYEHRPFGTETMRMDMGESSSSSSYNLYSNPYASGTPSFNPYFGKGMINNGYGNGYSGMNNNGYGNNGYSGYVASSEASSSKPPPPPPSPPRGSGWDFLNPFETFESYYPPHTPSSRDSKEVREEEGIPELEDEHEVVKEVYRNRNVSQEKRYSKEFEKDHVSKEIETDNNNNDDKMYGNSRASVENDPVEYEVHVVDKKVVGGGGGERSGDGGDVAGFKASGDSDVVREIQVQFDRASDAGTEVAKILEVGKFPYKKSAAHQVSSKVLQVITPSLPHHSNSESSAIGRSNPSYLDTDLVPGIRSGTLSSTLQKLYLWEKKLYEEVKVEEKMRILHERKCRKLKRLDETGAESQKIDTTRAVVRSLSTKIRMAIQVVDKISVTINKLRDEELWLQLNDVVQGLTRMWKAMYECHHIQSQAIAQAKRLDAAAMQKHFSDDQLQAILQLEHELLTWTFSFSSWVGEQKGFVQSLNKWLTKCLLYIPEETSDGIIPFSPGRLGAPPVFVVCNQWAQAMDRISEREVVDSMREFASSILHLWERDSLEVRQRMMTNKDMERKVKNLERKDHKIHKEILAMDKRIVLSSSGAVNGLPRHAVYQSETSKSGSLQSSLRHIFESMERFVSNFVKAYDELLQRIEEDRRDRLSRENHRENNS